MRNQVGIPPLERDVDAASGASALGAGAAKSPHHTPHRRSHPGMDPAVVEGARHGEAPYVGGYDRPVTERDTNAGLYIGLTIGVIVLILAIMLLSAFF